MLFYSMKEKRSEWQTNTRMTAVAQNIDRIYSAKAGVSYEFDLYMARASKPIGPIKSYIVFAIVFSFPFLFFHKLRFRRFIVKSI